MPDPSFRDLDPSRDRDALIDLLTTERWPHRVRSSYTEADVAGELERGQYSGDDDITLLIELDGEVVGLARADGLADDRLDPQLDFRLRERVRGRGIGGEALREITAAVFERHPDRRRIEGQTRRDNHAMRKVFARGGYVQEAVYRRAWPGANGELHDGIGYAILREDWESGTTTRVAWDQTGMERT
jgi:RimJ/RimL family protein N-acetyltransferase